jgi:hypothetical protein
MNAEVVCVQLPGCLGLGLLLAFFVAGALSKVEFISQLTFHTTSSECKDLTPRCLHDYAFIQCFFLFLSKFWPWIGVFFPLVELSTPGILCFLCGNQTENRRKMRSTTAPLNSKSQKIRYTLPCIQPIPWRLWSTSLPSWRIYPATFLLSSLDQWPK